MTNAINWLHSLPDYVILIGFTVVVPLYALALYGGLAYAYKNSKLPHDAYLGINMFNSSIAISAFLLTFTLVQALGTLQRVNQAVYEETAVIEQLDMVLLDYGEAEAADVRQKLQRYIKSVIVQELGASAASAGKKRVSKELYDLSYAITHQLLNKTTQQKELYDKSVSLMEDLGKARFQRMQHVGKTLAPVFLLGIFLLITTSILLFFYLSRKNRYSAFALLFQMTALGTLCGLVAIYDNPFTGESGVTAEAYETSLDMIQQRTDLNDD